jgi:hypothetical protein
MMTLAINGIALLLSALVVGIAVYKWHIIRDRKQILSITGNALKNKKAIISGVITAALYLAVFIFMGGKGGRVHLLFGQVIWNITPSDMAKGFILSILVMISIALFVFGIGVLGAEQSGRKSGMGFFGSLLALIAAFCP